MVRRREIAWIEDENGCYNCTSHILKDGYARFTVDGKKKYIHRYVYEQKYGKIPDGLVVRHKCDNPSCINVEHLELGTHRENMEDCVDRGRKARMYGENNSASKLTENEVLEILYSKEKYESIADKYNVGVLAVGRIKRGDTWRHIYEKADKEKIYINNSVKIDEKRVIEMLASGKSISSIARVFDCNRSVVYRIRDKNNKHIN